MKLPRREVLRLGAAASAMADQMAALMKNEIAPWTPIVKAASDS
jgi:hypothetical protein